MDYSRLGIDDKRKELKSISRRMGSKVIVTVFRVVILAVVALSIVGVVAAFGAFNGILDTTPDIEIVQLEVKGYSSQSLFADGSLAQNFAGNSANRIYVEIADIPEHVRNAFLAAEDRRFYQHSGIDIRTIFRSAKSLVTDSFEAGGSTVTQQLIKNQVFNGGREKYTLDKVLRKVQEQYLAINLEHVMSKDLILEYYMNMVNLGNNSYGVETAAHSYFGKTTAELTISEAAVIAGIPLSPTRLNPLTNPDENIERRNNILGNMYEYGWITQEEYDEAMADTGVYDRIAEASNRDDKVQIGTYSYFTDAMMDQYYKDMEERLGYTRAEAEHLLFYGGITIETTQDPEIQAILDRYYQDESNFPAFGFDSSHGSCYELSEYKLSVMHSDGKETHYQKSDFLNYFSDYDDKKGIYYHENGIRRGINELFLDMDDLEEKIAIFEADKIDEEAGDVVSGRKKEINPQPQSSMTIIEQSTGKVVAIYGGRGEKTVSRALNRASNSTRSVGSTFKVLASFLPALDAGGLTLASVQDDSPFFYPNGGKEVINWYSTGFRGLQSLRTGIKNSLNIVAVKTLEQIGAPLGFEYLKKLGFSTLVEYKVDENGKAYSDVNLAIALGGLTDGVTNLELTAAYASIANGGLYNKPIFYTRILDHEGNVILNNRTEPTQIMKASTAWLLTDAMHDVTTSGTGTRLAFRNYKMPVAGKTGTASKNSDLWFVGYTPYYTCAVWTGFDHPFNQWNKSYQQNLWRNIMEEIHSTRQLEYKEWEMPDSIVQATICTKCGNLAVYGLCDNAAGGSCIATEYFAKGTVPTKKCTCHTRVQICRESGKVATENCPEGDKVWAVLLIKDENYHKYDGYPGYTNGCWVSTWDTPYVYHPGSTCDVHQPGDADKDDEDGGGDGGDLFGEAHHAGAEDDVYD
ncbi:MAG: transglycosylase domain-containing protein [Lachnospiraceae bacterium]|nr:transglycosylase domain-containing protein [Lachnospiraceae bacterium]